MPPVPACPDARTLEQFLLGRTSQEVSEQLEKHLAACPSCAGRLSRVQAEDDLVAPLRQAPPLAEANPPLVQAVTPLLKQLYGKKDATASFAAASASMAETLAPETKSVSLGFLAPAQQNGELGRLGPY